MDQPPKTPTMFEGGGGEHGEEAKQMRCDEKKPAPEEPERKNEDAEKKSKDEQSKDEKHETGEGASAMASLSVQDVIDPPAPPSLLTNETRMLSSTPCGKEEALPPSVACGLFSFDSRKDEVVTLDIQEPQYITDVTVDSSFRLQMHQSTGNGNEAGERNAKGFMTCTSRCRSSFSLFLCLVILTLGFSLFFYQVLASKYRPA